MAVLEMQNSDSCMCGMTVTGWFFFVIFWPNPDSLSPSLQLLVVFEIHR